ncbi:MAG: hypothetical protein PVH68_02440 [Armatimonadota bacterium]|jgi:hypothetical protein
MASSALKLGVACMLAAMATAAVGDTLAEREMFADGWPRAFFFRAAEGTARSRRFAFEVWERGVLPLNGIMGKALDEEIPGTSETNVAFFTRFKANHPEKLVLLHYNGNARDPRDQSGGFFAGHWIYYNGCGITRELPAEAGESTVHVEDPSLFKTNMGRYRDRNEDIGICVLGADGRPDWRVSEQVELISVDAAARTLRVKRGAFGTEPRRFEAGRAYIAAHVTEGPWGQRNNLMWFYNHSLACPRDATGRVCADVLLDDLAAHFLPGGDLASFDGLEFDVMTFTRAPASGRIGARGHDCDADGKADYGILDGRNTYGIGVYDFCRRLRERLGDEKLILADGAGPRHQRGFGALNGIESEGWPVLSDWEVVDWSGGLNRHNFWRENAHPPAFSYVNHKFIQAGKPVRVPLSISRLVLASCLFTDSAITYSLQPARDEGQLIGIYDELVMGTQGRTNWLGMPTGAPRRLGFESPDLLRGEGRRWSRAFMKRWTSPNADLWTDARGLHAAGRRGASGPLLFTLRDVGAPAGDLLLRLRIQAEPMQGYPPEVARLVWVACLSAGELVTPRMPQTGMAVRGGAEGPIDQRTGATASYRDPGAIAGESHRSYYLHPPYRGATGYAFWETEATLPPDDCRLQFYTGLSDTARATSDGVTFKVLLREGGAEHEVFSRHHVERAWAQHAVDISRWQGKTVRLRFVSDVGPENNSVADQSYWGDVAVVRAGRTPRPREALSHTPGRIMTWAGPRPFDASFYFRDRGPDTVDFEFQVESVEPLTIADMSLHAAADAVCREYEHGAVLANPSMRPYTFDMAKLFPGERLRRLNGSPKQDPVANDGSGVGATLTLGARDGIFLSER